MKVLILGSGGREHALGWRLHQEGHEVHAAPGNPGLAQIGHTHAVNLARHDDVVALAHQLQVDLVVVGPERPLVEGIADALRDAGFAVFGPSKAAARLEASKAEAKAFMATHAIPTARHVTVGALGEGLAALRSFAEPPVVKADGLASGKGVTVADTFEAAEAALRACLEDARFGEAGTTVVLEERLSGAEVSLFVLSDGEHAVTMLPAADHKRLRDGDTGPNTGGMGAFVPAPWYTSDVAGKTMARIVRPTLRGLASEGRPFVGVLFIGLMIDPAGEPWVIEYNVRFGDPETQPLMAGLDGQLGTTMLAAATAGLGGDGELPGRPAATVVLASRGYPHAPKTGESISGLERANACESVTVFHAGTRERPGGGWETAGGRVLGVCACAPVLREALARAYAAVDCVNFEGVQVRRDIGHQAHSGEPHVPRKPVV